MSLTEFNFTINQR